MIPLTVMLLLLLLSHFSHVRLCATPEMTAHQAPPSLGFYRQERWIGLPFPSPMHETEKWKWSLSVVSNSATPWTAAYWATPSMGFPRQEYWSRLPFPTPGDLPNPGIEPTVLTFPALAGRLFTTGPPGKPLNWGSCGYSLLKVISCFETLKNL